MLWKSFFVVQRVRAVPSDSGALQTLSPAKESAKMKDPSGGTTGRVKAIWALGVDGRSRLI